MHIEGLNKRKVGEKAMFEQESVDKAWVIFPLLLGDIRNIYKMEKVSVTH